MKDFLRSSLKMLPNRNASIGDLLSQQSDGVFSSKEAKTRKKKESKQVLSSALDLGDYRDDDADLSVLFTK